MAFAHAGYWTDAIGDTAGNTLISTPVQLRNRSTHSVLTSFANSNRDALSGALATDIRGNLGIYYEPGKWEIYVPSTGISHDITILPDPDDLLALTLSVPGTDEWLKSTALAQAFLLTDDTPTYDPTTGLLTDADITWGDGTLGHYHVTSFDPNGGVTAFTITYAGPTTRTVTGTIPRNSAGQVVGQMSAVVS